MCLLPGPYWEPADYRLSSSFPTIQFQVQCDYMHHTIAQLLLKGTVSPDQIGLKSVILGY